jgi:hypothetical protein
MSAATRAEQLFGILETLVRYDLGDVKDKLTRDKIIDARDLARDLFRDEIRNYAAALVETIPHQEAAQ